MPRNTTFQFKQFLIHQDRCAMKVCTDSCVLGAYTNTTSTHRILDIGTGSGLLALMVAQRSNAKIDAVEIDSLAYSQALENVQRSPWNDRIQVVHQSIQDFSNQTRTSYDLIISNPPFFTKHLKRGNSAQNVALHSESLHFSELAAAVAQLIHPLGHFTVLLPPHESKLLADLLAFKGLFPTDLLYLFDYEGGKLIRMIQTYSFSKQACSESTLYIKDREGNYTAPFIQLLKPYYLHL